MKDHAEFPRIAVVGSLNVDLVTHAPRLPVPGETLLGTAFRTVSGGKGANQAVAAARLGASVAMIGCVGNDAFGARLHDALAAERIDLTHVHRIDGAATGVATITVDASGANSIVVVPGANARLDAATIDAARDAIAGAALMVCQLEVPMETVVRAIDRARACGTPVLLNPAPARPLSDALLARLEYLVVNETEAESLTGIAVGDDASAVRAADALHAKGAGNVLVTLGARGVCWRGSAGNGRHPALAVTAVDTTAAGDTFVGGFAAARAGGASMDDAIAFGQRAAAISVTRHGAQTSIPTREEVQHTTA
ncbi:ribokinase [Burkholderia vietnamiensis]|uniref:ribokinase n=1 Tax=Burkholderia vietnamiensis TaxID=60552 RepID=UPI00075BA64E|nr:ribokinase [Burkholderia vietnamiensis]AOK00046.1 ribokinase [Burkholderia vietnamiensis]KVE69129.1 ribokinase [Burkholderia vietnamiensis]MBR8034891.1 ribokinase [Burkholderia vietnamiensis]MDN8035485.1 ribokinase [Burkholderia vietnamiensis]HDR9005938.1 ribokinase [Burkholderia vietnamiensis]